MIHKKNHPQIQIINCCSTCSPLNLVTSKCYTANKLPTKNVSPFFLLIFVLEELFEFLRVFHIGAAVCLWVKHTQPSPPPNLNTHFTGKHSINVVQHQKGWLENKIKPQTMLLFDILSQGVLRKHKPIF